MKIGLIGTGKMGLPLALNAIDHKHGVIALARSKKRQDSLSKKGINSFLSYKEICENLKPPRLIWIMVPAGNAVDDVIVGILPHLEAGDIIVDAGNSNYNDTLRRSKYFHERDMHFMDVGTSGGLEGARNGACFMIGGDERIFTLLEPLYKDLATKNGYAYMGVSGSGHYVKMIHNGIEYGMMQAIGEGFDILKSSEFNLDYQKIAKVWNNGSIIEGFLMNLAKVAFESDPNLDKIIGRVDDSGEGQWTVEESIRLKVYSPIITTSLMSRYKSRDDENFSEKVISALRKEFGGHKIDEK